MSWTKGNPQTGTAILENSVEIPLQTGNRTASAIAWEYDQVISLQGINPKETRTERDTCTPMFIAALLAITMTWKQPRCPSADEWIRRL